MSYYLTIRENHRYVRKSTCMKKIINTVISLSMLATCLCMLRTSICADEIPYRGDMIWDWVKNECN